MLNKWSQSFAAARSERVIVTGADRSERVIVIGADRLHRRRQAERSQRHCVR